MSCAGRPYRLLLTLALTASGVGSAATLSMQVPPPAWAGWARCQINTQGTGYSEQQTHTWTMTGGTPTIEGAFRVYPGTWSVVGNGSLQQSQGAQRLIAEWAINATMPGPLAVFVRASDGHMFIQSRHQQLRQRDAVAGYQQQVINGVPQRPSTIGAEAFEWAFPTIEASSTNTTLTGSSTPPVTGSVGFMQQGGARSTASCTWQFGQGASAPGAPPALAAANVPVPGTGTGVPPGATAPNTPGQPGVTVPTATGPVLLQPPTLAGGAPPTATAAPAPPGVIGAPTLNTPVAPPTATLGPIQPARIYKTQGFAMSGKFTVPPGVTEITVELWGGGAGGHNGTSSGRDSLSPGKGGQGGGGGAYARWTLTRLLPGATFTVIVGIGGEREMNGKAFDGTGSSISDGQMVLLSAPGGKADGSGGHVSIAGLTDATLQDGNPGAPGGPAERLPGRLSQPGGAGGAGGAPFASAIQTGFLSGGGGRGGSGESIRCSAYDANGYGMHCTDSDPRWNGHGSRGNNGFVLIAW